MTDDEKISFLVIDKLTRNQCETLKIQEVVPVERAKIDADTIRHLASHSDQLKC